MREINATEFKQKCLAILDSLGPEGIVVTKRGKPVAQVTPIDDSPGALIGSMRAEIEIHGDIFSTGIDWDPESGHTHPDLRAQRRPAARRKTPAKR